ncbi:hypothetical protein MLD38_009294 [Melastoma candidum]|uniref:Uncharacterized protein n=1 Tax=Melastoma candidum TaxID=119954 RepID=A0ACB9RWJ1_9MYRT|nr:hypothetical protein MLD38_009294 [Melastoma candidum]
MEQLSPRFLFDLVMDDLGLFSNPSFNASLALEIHSLSSGSKLTSHSPVADESKQIIKNDPSVEARPIPGPTIRPKTEIIFYPDQGLLSQPSMSNPRMISFGEIYPSGECYGTDCSELTPDEMEELFKERSISIYSKSKKRTLGRMPLHAKDHVSAERKRREKLSRLFIDLSAMIPGLKKLDKASVLKEAIKYMKELKDRVKALEEDLTMISVKRAQLESDDGSSDSVAPLSDGSNRRLPEVVGRVLDKLVLLQIHLEKGHSSTVSILNGIEKLNLTILSHSILPFGNSIVCVTVVSEMDADFSLTIQDLVKNLRRALISSPKHSFDFSTSHFSFPSFS